MKLPRSLHRLYANLFGYFWTPCPICGEHFGGHEVSNACGYVLNKHETLPSFTVGTGETACPNPECKAAADARNEAFLRARREGTDFRVSTAALEGHGIRLLFSVTADPEKAAEAELNSAAIAYALLGKPTPKDNPDPEPRRY